MRNRIVLAAIAPYVPAAVRGVNAALAAVVPNLRRREAFVPPVGPFAEARVGDDRAVWWRGREEEGEGLYGAEPRGMHDVGEPGGVDGGVGADGGSRGLGSA